MIALELYNILNEVKKSNKVLFTKPFNCDNSNEDINNIN